LDRFVKAFLIFEVFSPIGLILKTYKRTFLCKLQYGSLKLPRQIYNREKKMRTKRIRFVRGLTSLFIIWILVLSVVPYASAKGVDISRDKIYLGGFLFGARIKTDGVLVVAVRDVESQNGIVSPAKDSGVLVGDIIKKVNRKAVTDCSEVSRVISDSKGNEVILDILRNGKELTFKITPVLSKDGESYKSGLWIRDGAAGIGTVTYVIPDSCEFAGLGHGICDSDTGALVPFGEGKTYSVNIYGITRGEKGSAGEIRGQLDEAETGKLTANTSTGVYGTFNGDFKQRPLVQIAPKGEVKEGDCSIFTTLDGNLEVEAKAEIVKILDTKTQTKNFLIQITDQSLIEKTGGIVQGMSGSPIIQNGKLVGAVTHVLVDEPTRGYGIFIENMLAEAEKIK
jgi:stage IV sporulation protein B